MKNLKEDMNRNYFNRILKSKERFHKKMASMPFEEKIKIIVELQKIDMEMRRSRKAKKSNIGIHKVWQL